MVGSAPLDPLLSSWAASWPAERLSAAYWIGSIGLALFGMLFAIVVFVDRSQQLLRPWDFLSAAGRLRASRAVADTPDYIRAHPWRMAGFLLGLGVFFLGVSGPVLVVEAGLASQPVVEETFSIEIVRDADGWSVRRR